MEFTRGVFRTKQIAMPIPERLTKAQIKEKYLDDFNRLDMETGMPTFISNKTIDDMLIEAYNQGTLCQNASHGNRVGHFDEWNK